MSRIKDPARFIREETRVRPVPHADEISLHVADEAMSLWQKTEDELGELGLDPPFWAFAWAGGQGLARYRFRSGRFTYADMTVFIFNIYSYKFYI